MTSNMTPEQLATTPAVPPPPGQVSNFINPYTKAPRLTAAIAVVLTLMLVTLFTRLYGKLRILRQFGLDDALAIVAGVINIASVALTLVIFWSPGFAVHTWNVPISVYLEPAYFNRLFSLGIVAPWGSYFSKMTILSFLLMIFPRRSNRTTAYFVYAGMALATVFYTTYTVYFGIECAPRGTRPVKCTNLIMLQVSEALAAVNMFLDLYILAIAVPKIIMLQMSASKKAGVILILCTGLIACVLSITALYYRANSDNDPDPAWNQCTPIILGPMETMVALIAACLPATPLVWRQLTTRYGSSIHRLLSIITNRGRSNKDTPIHSDGRTVNGWKFPSSKNSSQTEQGVTPIQEMDDLERRKHHQTTVAEEL